MSSEFLTAFIYSVLTGVTLYLCYSIFGHKRKYYPPGPLRLPLLGNLLTVGAEPQKAYARYAKKYGPIFSVGFGTEDGIILHGAKLIREAFSSSSFTGRPDKEAAKLFIIGNSDGIVMSEGSVWTEQRRFALRNLRDFGFGKSSLEGLIMDEVKDLIHWIKKQNEKPVQLHRRFSLAVVNSLWTILSGQRYDHDDPKLVGILEQFEKTSSTILAGKGKSLLIFYFPKIAKFFPNWSGWNYLLKTLEPRKKLFQETIQEHQRTFQDDHPRDFIDVYLQEIKKTTDSKSIFHQSTATTALESVMADFFTAGSDTTSSTLSWAILYLLHFPEIQTKIQEEIDTIVGKSKLPSIIDRTRMPYTEAFIMEVLRISSILSFGIPHTATEDVEFHGYRIPKGMSVFGSLYSTHHDPEVWGDPETFRPERFLSKDGPKVEKHDSFIPFSTGKRQCPGELLVKDQLFLFITSLAQNFRILNEPGKPLPTLEPVLKVTLEPQRYLVVMQDRF